jgi:hypothetical protein
MKRNKKRILVAGLAICALAAGGAAYTASNTIPNSTAGYETSTISGAKANDLSYKFGADGSVITGATVVFQGDLYDHHNTPATPYSVMAGFGTDASTSCTVGTYDNTTDETPVYCGSADVTNASTPFAQDTKQSTTFNVAVAGGLPLT